MLGREDIGVEWDRDACLTRRAAGHLTVRADVAQYPPGAFGTVEGLIASPPCQTFSSAGGGAGREQIDRLVAHAHRGALYDTPDPRTGLVLEPLRWIGHPPPAWLCLEQVPPVLPVWHAYEHHLRGVGYFTWSGVLNAADYGVPQTRQRAVLLASTTGPVRQPDPTHQAPPSGMFGLPEWVTWAEALGVHDGFVVEGRRGAGMTARHGDRTPTPATQPYPTVTGAAHRRHWLIDRRTNSRQAGGGSGPSVEVPGDRPAPTLTGKAGGQWVLRHGAQANATRRTDTQPAATIVGSLDNGDTQAISPDGSRYKLTVEGALILQSFPEGFPVQGNKGEQFQQIGNAIPPLLAAHVLAGLVGATVPEQVPA